MTDLEAMKAAPVPRPASVCRRIVGRGAPVYAFVLYGILYLVLVSNTALLAVLFGYVAALDAAGLTPMAGWAVVLGFVLCAAAFGLTSWPFWRWVRRRRGMIALLAREGVFVTGTVISAQALWVRGTPFTRGVIAVEVEGVPRKVVTSFGSHHADFVAGAIEPVLVHPGCPLAVAFPVGGRAVMARGWV